MRCAGPAAQALRRQRLPAAPPHHAPRHRHRGPTRRTLTQPAPRADAPHADANVTTDRRAASRQRAATASTCTCKKRTSAFYVNLFCLSTSNREKPRSSSRSIERHTGTRSSCTRDRARQALEGETLGGEIEGERWKGDTGTGVCPWADVFAPVQSANQAMQQEGAQGAVAGGSGSGSGAPGEELLGVVFGEPLVAVLRHAFRTGDFAGVAGAVGTCANAHVRAAAREAHRAVCAGGRADLEQLLAPYVGADAGTGGASATVPATPATPAIPAIPAAHGAGGGQTGAPLPRKLKRHEKVELARANETFSGDFFARAAEAEVRAAPSAPTPAPGTPVTVVAGVHASRHGVVQKKRTEAYKPGYLVVQLDNDDDDNDDTDDIDENDDNDDDNDDGNGNDNGTGNGSVADADGKPAAPSQGRRRGKARPRPRPQTVAVLEADLRPRFEHGGAGDGGGNRVGVVTVDVEHPTNGGAVCRLLSNFAPQGAGAVYTHLSSQATKKPDHLLQQVRFRVVAAGTQKKVNHVCETTQQFCRRLAAHGPAPAHTPREAGAPRASPTPTTAPTHLSAPTSTPTPTRPPLVVIETARSAVPIYDFAFPAVCDIVVVR